VATSLTFMTRYECCFSSGRQFVFTERQSRSPESFLFAAIFGMVCGLFVAITLNCGGVQTLERIFLTLAVIATVISYYFCFHRIPDITSSSPDLPGYVIWFTLLAAILFSIWAMVQWSFFLNVQNRCLFFGIIGVMTALILYVFVTACTSEDERKHHLYPCAQTGGLLVDYTTAVGSRSMLTSISRYLSYLCKYDVAASSDESLADSSNAAADHIVIRNQTLKLIKVCLYASDDVLCWVPYALVSGKCVGFVQAEQSMAFKPPTKWQVKGGFRLKVFEPAIFDKELASFPNAQLGQCFAFRDVEGMIKRSRTLAAKPGASSMAMTKSLSLGETSESEYEGPEMRANDESSSVTESMSMEPGGLMKRNRSACENLLQFHSQTSPSASGCSGSLKKQISPSASGCSGETGDSPSRRANPDEIVVRNRSNQEIRILLFRSTDYSFMVPLVGHLLSSSDSILPDGYRRFNPNVKDIEFTAKVYSVGPGARELTYLTVERGQVYTIRDSLVS